MTRRKRMMILPLFESVNNENPIGQREVNYPPAEELHVTIRNVPMTFKLGHTFMKQHGYIKQVKDAK